MVQLDQYIYVWRVVPDLLQEAEGLALMPVLTETVGFYLYNVYCSTTLKFQHLFCGLFCFGSVLIFFFKRVLCFFQCKEKHF